MEWPNPAGPGTAPSLPARAEVAALQSHRKLSEYGIMAGDTIECVEQPDNPASKASPLQAVCAVSSLGVQEALLGHIECSHVLTMEPQKAVLALGFLDENHVATASQAPCLTPPRMPLTQRLAGE